MTRARPRLPGPTQGLSIGLVGGSFDPAHQGHVHVIETARKRLGLDWVWVIPTAGNPLKRTQTPYADRLHAARIRFAGPRTRVSDIERALGSPYTIDLVRALKRHAPTARFVLLIGGDNLAAFHRWKDWQQLAREIPIAVISRPRGNPKAGLSRFARTFATRRLPLEAARTLPRQPAPAWTYLPAPFDPNSSTMLRALMFPAPTPPI